MSEDVVIVGGGVVGMITALTALKRGRHVTLIDAGGEGAISWGDVRIIRDDMPFRPSGDIARWRVLLREIGHDPVSAPGLDWIDTPKPAGNDVELHRSGVDWRAFSLETTGVRTALVRALRQSRKCRIVSGRVVNVDPVKRAVRTASGERFKAQNVVIAAGAASAELAGFSPELWPTLAVQAFAVLKNTGDPSTHEPKRAFIQHTPDGVWGTPRLGEAPAKVSASSLCFDSKEEARRFIDDPNHLRAFTDRVRAVLPSLGGQQIDSWRIASYPHSAGCPILQRGSINILNACNGSGFRRAPRLAAALLSNTSNA